MPKTYTMMVKKKKKTLLKRKKIYEEGKKKKKKWSDEGEENSNWLFICNYFYFNSNFLNKM